MAQPTIELVPSDFQETNQTFSITPAQRDTVQSWKDEPALEYKTNIPTKHLKFIVDFLHHQDGSPTEALPQPIPVKQDGTHPMLREIIKDQWTVEFIETIALEQTKDLCDLLTHCCEIGYEDLINLGAAKISRIGVKLSIDQVEPALTGPWPEELIEFPKSE